MGPSSAAYQHRNNDIKHFKKTSGLSSVWSFTTVVSLIGVVFHHGGVPHQCGLSPRWCLSSVWSFSTVVSLFSVVFHHDGVSHQYGLSARWSFARGPAVNYARVKRNLKGCPFQLHSRRYKILCVLCSSRPPSPIDKTHLNQTPVKLFNALCHEKLSRLQPKTTSASLSIRLKTNKVQQEGTVQQLQTNKDRVECCFTSTETTRTIRDGEPMTSIASFIASELCRKIVNRAFYVQTNERSCWSPESLSLIHI